MLTFGIGTPKDAQRAAASYRKACAGDDDGGCHNVEDQSEHWITGPTSMAPATFDADTLEVEAT